MAKANPAVCVQLPRMGVRAHLLGLSLPTVLWLAACATPQAPTSAQTPVERVEEADRMVRRLDFGPADRILRGVIDSRDFQTLDPAHRHQALLLGARTALHLHDPRRGLSLLKRACEFPQAGADDWFERVWAASATHDQDDAATALVVLTRRWPKALLRFESSGDSGKQALGLAVAALRDSSSDADRYSVLSALLNTRFPEEPALASAWWHDLALLQLARGERDAAVTTLARVTGAYVVISIEADKRFDPIRRELSAKLDVTATAERDIAACEREIAENPTSLKSISRLGPLLRHSLRFEQALRIDDEVIERQEGQGYAVYEGYARYYPWILNDRAYALFALGRWDAAVTQMETASRMSEDGTPNVSQTLNLAVMYSELGKPAEALKTLERVGPASYYGDMVGQSVRLDAAVQLNDAKAVGEALEFLSNHRRDSLGAYQDALLVVDRADEAAKLLISRLTDPRLRSAALLAVQEYGEVQRPPRMELLAQRWRALVARSDVQEAIRAVGYVKRYPLLP